jgi:hypothetical protein
MTTLPLHASYLRPIAEDASDVGSSLAGDNNHMNTGAGGIEVGLFSLPVDAASNQMPTNRRSGGSVGSTKGVQAGHAGSVISDASAVLADDTDETGDGTGTRTPAAAEAAVATTGAAYSPRGLQHGQRRKQRRFLVIAMCAVAVAVVAALAAIFTTRSDNDDTSISGNLDGENGASLVAPTASPIPGTTAAPSYDPYVTQWLDAVILTVPTANTSESDAANSPQSRARTWMLETDELRDSLLLTSEDRVRQRYALTVFYYATAMPADATTRAVTTVGVDVDAGSESGDSSSDMEQDLDEDQDEFLVPSTSECEWTGISCDETNAVTYLTLGYGQFNLTGTLPHELAALTALRKVDLSHNSLQGELPDTIVAAWQDLYWLDLSENQLQGSIPDALWSLQVLRYIYLHDNLLTGELLSELGNSDSNPALEDVWLYNNLLLGPLPTWVSTLISLESWIIFGNAMTGALPEFGLGENQFPLNLTYFDVSDNKMAGTLPETLFTVPSGSTLKYLYLESNLLHGPLPAGDQPAALKEVWLHSNQLTGTVPSGFGAQWLNLRELFIQDNNVTGTLGDSKQCDQWTKLEELQADCNHEVTCGCCTLCTDVLV